MALSGASEKGLPLKALGSAASCFRQRHRAVIGPAQGDDYGTALSLRRRNHRIFESRNDSVGDVVELFIRHVAE